MVLLLDALDEADPLLEQLAASAKAAREALAAEGVALPPPPLPEGEDAASFVPAGNRAFQLLKDQLLPRLPRNVRLIITTRPDAIGARVLPALHSVSDGSCVELSPALLRHDNGDAATEAAPRDSRVMLVQTVRQEVLGQGTPDNAVDADADACNMETLGALYAAYNLAFQRQWQVLTAEQCVAVKELVDVLAAAQEPLSLALLQRMGLHDTVSLLPGWGTLFFAAEHRVFLLHKSLADWLADSSTDARFRVDATYGHARLGLHLAKGVLETSVSDKDASWPRYTLCYLMRHLVEAAAGAAGAGSSSAAGGPTHGSAGGDGSGGSASSTFDALLLRTDFLDAVLRAGQHGRLIADLAAGVRQGGVSALAKDMLRFLRKCQHKLTGEGKGGVLARAAAAPCQTLVYQALMRCDVARVKRGGPKGWVANKLEVNAKHPREWTGEEMRLKVRARAHAVHLQLRCVQRRDANKAPRVRFMHAWSLHELGVCFKVRRV